MVTTDSMLRVSGTVAAAFQKSVTVTVRVAVVGLVAVPVNTPVLDNWNPRVFAPKDHDLTGVVPPLICRVAVYGTFTTPLGSDEGAIDGSALQCTVSPVTELVAGDGTALSVTE
jgi:hypothetical protein